MNFSILQFYLHWFLFLLSKTILSNCELRDALYSTEALDGKQRSMEWKKLRARNRKKWVRKKHTVGSIAVRPWEHFRWKANKSHKISKSIAYYSNFQSNRSILGFNDAESHTQKTIQSLCFMSSYTYDPRGWTREIYLSLDDCVRYWESILLLILSETIDIWVRLRWKLASGFRTCVY